MAEVYKFQKLQVYQLALAYVDAVYALSRLLPEWERYNLSSQIERAGTSIVLNIAEGSTGQTDAEQNRFLGLALRSYLETIACCDLIERRAYLKSDALDALPWRWNCKHTGHLADWETIPQQTRAALAQRLIPEKNETWRYGMYSYNRFRSDTGRELLCKFPVKAV